MTDTPNPTTSTIPAGPRLPDPSELRGATLAWRSVLRHAAAQIGCLAGRATFDRDTQLAYGDAVRYVNTACALLTQIDTVLDTHAPDRARAHCAADLARHARTVTR